ncbi:DUF4442 domain-containing protein [Aliiglaciecola sp. LCG003]|uniref:DUF4442 domain-containing protein n=1 Tax=Aliiglaciecola sp. LCG003 TaxID=3053655 RepID=UPI0025740F3C|nr:DUF4442 domain-containing protein [Aliiglaciecola sp. LCG003]WJG10067.1 DUF4442 domain-containing protein [Aliiglaciecola sp. LCG003]
MRLIHMTKAISNPLRKFVDKVNHYPSWLSSFLMTQVFRHTVKLAGTVKVDIIRTDGHTVVFKQKNRRKVRNHIGTVHAATMALLAESATGFIVGINLPGDKLPLIKTMNLNYVKRCTGDITAVASLTDEQIALMQTAAKGEVSVKVEITDGMEVTPLVAEMIWAWVPKK